MEKDFFTAVLRTGSWGLGFGAGKKGGATAGSGKGGTGGEGSGSGFGTGASAGSAGSAGSAASESSSWWRRAFDRARQVFTFGRKHSVHVQLPSLLEFFREMRFADEMSRKGPRPPQPPSGGFKKSSGSGGGGGESQASSEAGDRRGRQQRGSIFAKDGDVGLDDAAGSSAGSSAAPGWFGWFGDLFQRAREFVEEGLGEKDDENSMSPTARLIRQAWDELYEQEWDAVIDEANLLRACAAAGEAEVDELELVELYDALSKTIVNLSQVHVQFADQGVAVAKFTEGNFLQMLPFAPGMVR